MSTERAVRQLVELYLPLTVMQMRGKRALQMFGALIGRTRGIFDGRPLSERELDLWTRWMEQVFIPMNQQMVDLIMAKAELIDLPVPRCMMELLRHNDDLKLELARWKDEGGQWYHPSNFPADLEKHILSEVGRLSVEIEWLEKMPM